MSATTDKPKPAGRKAEPLSPEEQRQRFEDAARELACDSSEDAFNAALDVIGRHKPDAKESRPAKP